MDFFKASQIMILIFVVFWIQSLKGEEPSVGKIKAFYRNGQTFVTWRDAAEGEEGSGYRYNLYTSKEKITQANINKARLLMANIHNNSGKHYGFGLVMKARINPKTPMAIIEFKGKPLLLWTGLAVRTISEDGNSFYAVQVTDTEGRILSRIVPGESATVVPIDEKIAPIEPIKTGDSKTRGKWANRHKITGTKKLPLSIYLHHSNINGGSGDKHGDYYLYWGRSEWGYREGLQWQFIVSEQADKLVCMSRETMANPNGTSAIQTHWFGYLCIPQWANHKEPRAYNFTERRMLWMLKWVIKKYNADPERVYCSGMSMGAWGTASFALRHPEIFAAIYPNRPRIRRKVLPAFVKGKSNKKAMMYDGKESYFKRMDMVKFIRNHHGDLPFIGWCCGRHDGHATFKEQIEMVKALTEGHHGFAFAWNDGNHAGGIKAMEEIIKYYPSDKFARNQSYPAFGNSSINDELGTGEVEVRIGKRIKRVLKKGNGALTGGINLGFDWKEIIDEPGRWSVKISNTLCKELMTVDLTPRRCQKFKPTPYSKFNWSSSTGDKGVVVVDKWGLITIEKLKIRPREVTELKISKTMDNCKF